MINKFFKGKMVKDSIFSLVSKGYAMVLFLVTDILLARALGVNAYAEWNFFYSFIDMVFPIVWFGINVASRVYVARHEDEEEIRLGIQSATMLRIIVSVLLVCVYSLISIKLPYYLGYPEKYSHLKSMMQLGGLYIFVNSVVEFYKDINISIRNFKNVFLISIVEFTGYFFFSAFFLLSGKKEASYVEAAYIITSVCVCVMQVLQLKKYYSVKDWRDKKDVICQTAVKILKDALPFLIISCGTLILVEMDSFMIGLMKSGEEVANYSIAKKFCSKASHINVALCASTMPVFARLSSDNVVEMKAKFKKVAMVHIGFTVLVSLLFVFIVPMAITILYGVEYADAGKVLLVLTPYYAFNGIGKFMASFLDYQNMTKSRGAWYILTVVLNLIFNLILIPDFGATGAAFASSVSMIPYVLFMVIKVKEIWEMNGNA